MHKKRKRLTQRALFFASLRASLGGECEECARPDSYTVDFRGCMRSVLEFHHVLPRKTHGGTRVTSLGRKSAVAEAAKCVLLCADCHSRYHSEEETHDEVPF